MMLSDLNEAGHRIGEAEILIERALDVFESDKKIVDEARYARGMPDAYREMQVASFKLVNALSSIRPLLVGIRVSAERVTRRLVKME